VLACCSVPWLTSKSEDGLSSTADLLRGDRDRQAGGGNLYVAKQRRSGDVTIVTSFRSATRGQDLHRDGVHEAFGALALRGLMLFDCLTSRGDGGPP
jgi:hypothetical protein